MNHNELTQSELHEVNETKGYFGREKLIAEVEEKLQTRSVALIGITNNGTLPVFLHIVDRFPTDSSVVVSLTAIEGAARENSPETLQSELLTIVTNALVSAGKLPTLQAENVSDRESDTLDVRLERLIEIFKALAAQNRQAEQFLVALDRFEMVLQTKYCRAVCETLSRLIVSAPRLRLLLAIDACTTNRSQLLEVHLDRLMEVIPVPAALPSDQADLLVGNLLILDNSKMAPIKKRILEITGCIPILLETLIPEINELYHSLPSNGTIATFLEGLQNFVGEAVDRATKKGEALLFGRWWKHLSISEQLVVILMREQRKPCYVDDLKRQIRARTDAKVEVTYVMENLRHKCFVQDTVKGWNLISEWHQIWVDDLMEDPQREIGARLLALAKQPTPFDLEFVRKHVDLVTPAAVSEATVKPVILHLSDIHFGKAHAFDKVADVGFCGLLSSLRNDIQDRHPGEGIPTPNLIVVSGDISDWGMPDEYERAEKFLDELVEFIQKMPGGPKGFSRDRVVLVPGNHDVNWPLSQAGKTQVEGKSTATSLYPFRLEPFRHFFEHFYRSRRTYSSMPAEEYTIYNFTAELRLVVVGFNSCYDLDHENPSGCIFLDAIENAEKEIERLKKEGAIQSSKLRTRIAVWHHDINLSSLSTDHLTNADRVLSKLGELGYSLILTGHVHRLDEKEIASAHGGKPYRTVVMGAGSLGVKANERPGDPKVGQTPLSYNVIELNLRASPNQVRIHTRVGQSLEEGEVAWHCWTGWPSPEIRYRDISLA